MIQNLQVGRGFYGVYVRGLFHSRKKGGLIKRVKPDNKTHRPFRRDIQALRAFAVLAVVVYHIWPNRLVGGFTGVDIFFVISGYLMTVSIMRHLGPLIDKRTITFKSVTHVLVEFYARRIKRLVPAALTTILGILALAQLTGNLNVIITNAKNAISAATFWQNWFLAKDSLNYLQQDNLIVATQHFWSLSVEEQFYLAWPLLLVIGTLITISITVLYKKNKIPGVILPITLLTLGSIAYGIWLTKTNPSLAYYSTPARVWELMIGGIVAFLPAIKSYDLKLLMPYAGLVINIFSIFYISATGFPGWWALLPTIGTAMIIWGGTGRHESKLSFDNAFSWRPIQWTGDISYSIYLWHFPLIILLPIVLHRDINGAHGMLFKITIIIISFIIAWLSYKFIEQSSQKIQLKARYIYILFIIATGIVVALSFYTKDRAETQVQTNLNSMHTSALDESNICFGARAILHQDKCGNPYGVTDSGYMSVGRTDLWARIISDNNRPCYQFFIESGRDNVQKFCTFGDTRSEKSIALFGDSHAEQYVNTLDYIGKKYHLKVILLNLGTCSTNAFNDLEISPKCKQRLEFTTSPKLLNKQSLIVISSAFKGDTNIDKLITVVNNSTTTPWVLVKDIPQTTQTRLTNCYIYRIDCNNNRKQALSEVESTLSRLIANKDVDKSQIIDITKGYCDKKYCYSSIGGVPVYFNTLSTSYNNSHATPSYSLTLAPLMEQELLKAAYLN